METVACRWCGSKISKKRKSQEFCSDSCRWRHWAENHPRIAKDKKFDDIIPCYYCGLPATTIDHVPPRTLRGRLIELKLDKRYEFFELDSCLECNLLLGPRAIFSRGDRKRFIKLALRKRYRRFLNISTWTDREISELGYTLKTSIISRFLMSEIIRERINW